MRALAAAFAVALSVLVQTSAWAATGARRVIITFKAGTSQAAREKALAGMKARGLKNIVSADSTREFVAVVAELSTPAPSAPKARALDASGFAFAALGSGVDAAAASADVVQVEEDYKIKWIETSAPASFSATPFLESASLGSLGLKKFAASAGRVEAQSMRSEIPWGISRVKAPAAWDYTQGAGVRVAVIDTGIDFSHPELSGKVDGGYSAIADSEKPADYKDDNGHGTHVSGTIAAKGGIRGGVIGVAPKARLYAIKVLDSEGSGSLSDVIKGIVWAADNGMQVANMSLGSPMPSEAMHRALRYAKAKGVVVVAAAGNSGGSVGYPGAYPETIAVSASDWNDKLAIFSSRGPEVKFVAPGVAVLSTAMGGDYVTMSGTSMATPHVTGLAALAVSQGYRGLEGPEGVLGQLEAAAKPLEGLDPTDQGAGMIDAGRLTRGGSPMVAALQVVPGPVAR